MQFLLFADSFRTIKNVQISPLAILLALNHPTMMYMYTTHSLKNYGCGTSTVSWFYRSENIFTSSSTLMYHKFSVMVITQIILYFVDPIKKLFLKIISY
jgi:hypothetical protein